MLLAKRFKFRGVSCDMTMFSQINKTMGFPSFYKP